MSCSGSPYVAMSVAVGLFASPSLARQWTPTTSLDDDWTQHRLVAASNHLYHIGGIGGVCGNACANQVLYAAIDAQGEIGAWNQGAPLPAHIFLHGAVAANNMLFAIGGMHWNGGTNLAASSEVYFSHLDANGTPGPWQATFSFPAPIRWVEAAVWSNRIYITGGLDETGNLLLSTVYSAEISDNGLSPWREETALPLAMHAHASVAVGGALYVIGGIVDGGYSLHNAVWYAPINENGTLEGWSAASPLPVAIAGHDAAAFCGRIYVTGGYNQVPGIAVESVTWADVLPDHSLQAWSPAADLPLPLWSHAMAITGTHAYVSGGASIFTNSTAVFLMPLPLDATAPAITQQPVNQTVDAGGSASFSIAATGRAPLTYHWRKDGVNLIDGGSVSGAMTATLTINPVQIADAASYDALVMNDCGSAQSESVLLMVNQGCRADINHSGSVNVLDLLAVVNAWGPCGAPCPPRCAADIAPIGPTQGQCQVNVADLLAVINAWGACP